MRRAALAGVVLCACRAPAPAPPWPTETELSVSGDPACATFARPCNHAIHMAVRQRGGAWEVLPQPLVRSGSVPDGMVVPTEHDGQTWDVLWVTYVDENPANRTSPEQEHVVSVATLAWPTGSVTTAAQARRVLTGDGWGFARTNLAEINPTAVDPDREVIDGPGGRRHYLIAVDLVVEPPAGADPRGVSPAPPIVYESRDGLHFTELGRVALDAPDGFGTDPDFFPLGWSADYPAVLPADYAPGGSGRWAVWASNGPRLRGFQGELTALAPSFVLPADGSVSNTTLREGRVLTYAHRTRESRLDLPADAVLHEVFPDGSFRTAVALSPEAHPATRRGVWSPSVVPLSGDVDLLLFHTYLRGPEELSPLPPGAPGSLR